MIRRPPRSTRTDTLFPYTTLFRSWPHSIITLDPSNELAPMTIAARKKIRRDVIVVSPNDPETSGFNVLGWIDPESAEADDNVASVVQWIAGDDQAEPGDSRSEEHTSELQSLMRISYAVFCLKQQKHTS